MIRKIRVGLAVLLLLVLASACKDGTPTIGKKKESNKADIKITQVIASDPSERQEGTDRANQESQKVKALLDRFYQAAFLQVGEEQADLSPHFTAEAQAGLAPNIGALALGDIAPRLKRVTPKRQEATKVSFLIEEDLSVPVVIATVVFEATGEAKEKADGPVAISHNATFWLQPEGDGYNIFGYSTELKADTQTNKAAFGIPAAQLRGAGL